LVYTNDHQLANKAHAYQCVHGEKHLSEVYPQDGDESQLASKLRHCHPMYILFEKYINILALKMPPVL